MEFLYSLNRLNVATSRAKCVSILAGSPQIFEAECKTPRQMQLANAFCRYVEMAEEIGRKRTGMPASSSSNKTTSSASSGSGVIDPTAC
jgi:superfamily I DNA and/or RNA helicase